MTSVSHHAPEGKPHYTYVLKYPEDYPELDKAGTVFYVGKGKGKRIHQHEQEARKDIQSYKCNVIRKIWTTGCQITKKILAYFETHEEAILYEIALVFFLPNLTNLTDGGEGIPGLEVTEATKQKIIASLTGQVFSPERRQKIGQAHRGIPKGPPSAEHRRNLSKAKTGKSQSEEHRRKNSEGHKGQPAWNKGIPQSEEHRRKNSEVRKGKPLPFTEEHKHNLKTSPKAIEQRRRLAESNKGRPFTEERRQNISKALKGRPKPLSEKGRQRLVEYNMSRRGKPRLPSKKSTS